MNYLWMLCSKFSLTMPGAPQFVPTPRRTCSRAWLAARSWRSSGPARWARSWQRRADPRTVRVPRPAPRRCPRRPGVSCSRSGLGRCTHLHLVKHGHLFISSHLCWCIFPLISLCQFVSLSIYTFSSIIYELNLAFLHFGIILLLGFDRIHDYWIIRL